MPADGQGPTSSEALARPTSTARRTPEIEVTLDEPLPPRLAVGGGTAVFVKGRCRRPEGCRIARIELLANGEARPLMAHGVPSRGDSAERWWGVIPFAQVAVAAPVRLSLHAVLESGEHAYGDVGTTLLEPQLPVPQVEYDARPSDQPLIAICMATFDPPLDLFERQIDSIRQQTHDNWICLISDDHSRPERLSEMRRILGDDPRFVLVPATERLGYYGNFERALAMVPPDVEYVGLADQDDRWYGERLATLAAELDSGAILAYSDMRVAASDGTVLSDTYWRYRRNNHTDFTSLLITNSITGAASLFRRDLLDTVLPFPPAHGDIFHDHWIALVAMIRGEVRYVDRPLYDYVQHSQATLGYMKAMAGRGRWGGRAADLVMRLLRLGWRLIRPVGEIRYFENYCRLALEARALELRCGGLMTPIQRRSTRRILACDRSLLGAGWLALRSLRPLIGHDETMGMERGLAAGIIWRRRAQWRARLARASRAG